MTILTHTIDEPNDDCSDRAKELSQKYLVGRPTLYDPNKHIELLIRVFLSGGTVNMFCQQAGIGRKTFYHWRKDNRNFRLAYEDAKTYAEAFYDEMGLNPPDNFNYSAWIHAMKVRFGHSSERTLNLRYPKNKQQQNNFESLLCLDLLKKVYRGEVNPFEFSTMITALLKKIEIDRLPKLQARLDAIEQNIKQNPRT
jgi:hypothetical protein